MGIESTATQWYTIITSALLIVGGIVGAVFAFYRYVRKDIDSRINERFVILEADLSKHIDDSEVSLNEFKQQLKKLDEDSQHAIGGLKEEFKVIYKLIGDLGQSMLTKFGDIKGDVAVLNTKLDMYFTHLRKEE